MLNKTLVILIASLLGAPHAHAQFNPFKAAKELSDALEKSSSKERSDEASRGAAARRAPGHETGPVSLGPGRTLSYAGYSKSFLPLKSKLLSGDLESVDAHYTKKEKKARKKSKGDDHKYYRKVGFLDFVEHGTLELSQGDLEGSIAAYGAAEQVLNLRNDESKATEKSKTLMGKFGGMVIGKDELVPYYGVGFERILMLNGKAIAYLLNGDRLAYNVTRRSIDWQNTEKAAFDAEQREIQEDLERKRGENPFSEIVEKMVWAAYADYETKAQAVPSAFVNPFGFYMAGMIQEFESADDPSLIDNARISYGKALELNPNSKVIRQAHQAMKKREKAGGRRLVHVVAFDGFTPEKKVLEFRVRVSPEMNVPVKLPVYEPVGSRVSALEVSANGKKLAGLEEVASVEAISLRYQSDQRSKQALDVLIRVAASVGKRSGAGSNRLALAAVEMHDSLSTPDMRSWMSLPATISAARFYAPPGVDSIEIHSRDEAGRAVGTRSIAISDGGPTFVFVRSMDDQLLAHANQSLWFN